METEQVWTWAGLVAFCVQNAETPIVFWFGMTQATKSERASTSMILFFTEFMKFGMSFIFLVFEHDGDVIKSFQIIQQDALSNPPESLPLAIPTVIYVLQKALLQWTSGNLLAAPFQVTYQGKILVTAAFSVTLLQKQIKRVQWLANFIMRSGIVSVQMADVKELKQSEMANADEQNVMLGFAMLFLACCCSGFASVFTEKVLKQVGSAPGQKKSVWLQNMQITFLSIIVCVSIATGETLFPWNEGDGGRAVLHGFTWKTWAMATNNAIGGLLVALVIKYADNTLRGFASAVATTISALMSVYLFGLELNLTFLLGSVMVIGSTMLYRNIIKMPTNQEWWNAESDLCTASRQDSCTASSAQLPTSEHNSKEEEMQLPRPAA